ncbi:MAG: molybdopterin-dependent oxidoreductase [Pseudomonadota bacterium]
MQKRQFLGQVGQIGLAGLAGAALPATALAAPAPAGPALLTLTGAVGKPNRGRFDPVRDQMMHKQKLSFERAHAFDFAALLALPAVDIAPTLEYDGKTHALRGPLLVDVLKAAGVALRDGGKLVLRAVDGYAVGVTQAQVRAQRYIVATHLDGRTMALGGLGPLWAVYDADRVAEMAAKALPERFASCPWALYHIDVLD